jgi:hypothetical protein
MMDPELRTLDLHPELTVSVRWGVEHFRGGQFTVRADGDGAATVEHRRAGTLTEYRAHLTAARVAQVGMALAKHRFSAPRRSKLPREPDDSQLILILARKGTPLFQADLWTGDCWNDADLNAILDLAIDLVFEISGGKLGHPKRSSP